MRPVRVLALLLSTLALAGCADGEDEPMDDPMPVDPATYAITLSDLPTLPVAPNTQFRFNSTVSGATTHPSDHIGAHFGNRTTTEPSTAIYNVTCVHTTGDLPGRYQVTCTSPMTAGVYYLRGHARITQGTDVVNWWSPEASFTVAPVQGNQA